ncbi:hypothetical protein ABMA27_001298 [Loxostege sticticalis]|uniref:FLYWCH-type domain-containing protein n=1 Tax=Loxostege sticticalis TaxID=481309 RepID=A0ABR3HY46_LOXSC
MGLHQSDLLRIHPPRSTTQYPEQLQNKPQPSSEQASQDGLWEICKNTRKLVLLNIFMTARGKERLVYQNFTYYKQSRTRSGFRWGCTKNRWHRCKAYLHLADDMTIVRSNMEHTHSAYSSTSK